MKIKIDTRTHEIVLLGNRYFVQYSDVGYVLSKWNAPRITYETSRYAALPCLMSVSSARGGKGVLSGVLLTDQGGKLRVVEAHVPCRLCRA